MADAHKNFAYSTVLTAPSPASSGTSLVVQSGDGAKFPTPPFNATVWPVSTNPLTSNAEIVRVTAVATDTLTITRAQESSSARTVVVGDQITATITAQTLTDVEQNVYVTTSDKTVPATTQVIFDDYLEVAASFFYELSADAILAIGDFATPLPAPDQNTNIFVTVNNETIPPNSEVVFSDFYELSAPFGTELGNGALMQIGTGTPVPVAPGTQLDYVQITAPVTMTGTTDATADLVIQGNPIVLDGLTRIRIEYFLGASITTANEVVFVLYDGATDIGRTSFAGNQGTTTTDFWVPGACFLTPSAGTHTYSIRAWKVAAGTAVSVYGGAGGAGVNMPGWYKVSTA